MGSQFRIIFSGQLLVGHDPQQVKQKLAALHKTSLAQIEPFFSGQATVVTIVKDYATAQKIQNAYENVGAVCRIEPDTNDNAPPQPLSRPDKMTSQTGKLMTCPKCGFEQPPSKGCARCGVIIEKFQQRQEQRLLEESARKDAVIGTDISQLSIIEHLENENVRFEVLMYDTLSGSGNLAVARMIYYANRSHVKLKQVRITVFESAVTLEAGALHFLKGNITIESTVGGVGGLLKKAASKALTKETAFKPTYSGSGEIYLEPSFGHFILVELANEEIIVDKGMFLCCENSVSVDIAMQKGVTAGLFGGEGWFQTKLSGRGICVLQSPVPKNEIIVLKLHNETVQVDGNFALLRKGHIAFTVERSTKSLLGTVTSGEGLLQTFKGTGEVWLAPTQSIYERLYYKGLAAMSGVARSSGTQTKSNKSK